MADTSAMRASVMSAPSGEQQFHPAGEEDEKEEGAKNDDEKKGGGR